MIPQLTVERSIPAPGTHLCGLAWDGHYLWHSDASTDRLYRIDPATGKVLAEIPCPEVRTDLAYDGKNLWQIAGSPKKILILDPEKGQLLVEIPLGPNSEQACGLTVARGRYWVAFEHLALITEHSLLNQKLREEYPAQPRVAGLQVVGDALWYTEYEQALLVELDMVSGTERKRYRVPGNPTSLCWDGQRFWYSDFTNRLISAVRPK